MILVPITVIKQHYGADVKHQAFHDLINDSFRQAVQEQKLRTVGNPQIDTPDHKHGEGAHDHAIEEGHELTYIATVEVLPEIEVKNYKGFALNRESAEITDKDVDVIINNMLDGQAELVPVSGGGLVGADGKAMGGRAVKKADHVDLAFSGGIVTPTGIEAKEGMKGSRVVEIGSDSLIPGFEDQIIGMKNGETKTFRIPFPKEYFEAEIAGKDAEFTVTVNEIKEKKLPTLDDEFAKTAGYDNVADLKAKAREHLVRERTTEVDRKLRSDLLAQLIEKNQFDCPQALIQSQTRALAQELGNNLKQQGFDDAMIQQAMMSELENLKKRAENQVRASLLLEAIAKKEKLTISPADIELEIKTMAVSMRMDEAKIREFYEQTPGRREDLEFRMTEEKAVKFLLDGAKIKG